MPPAAKPLLYRLGFWDVFQKKPHLVSPGIVSAWSDPEPYDNDFIFNPYGPGWHLDRQRSQRGRAIAITRVWRSGDDLSIPRALPM